MNRKLYEPYIDGTLIMTISRPNNKGFTLQFPTLQDAKNFTNFIEDLIENVKKGEVKHA